MLDDTALTFEQCSQLIPRGFQNKAIGPEAYSNHHWLHTWLRQDDFGSDDFDNIVNIAREEKHNITIGLEGG